MPRISTGAIGAAGDARGDDASSSDLSTGAAPSASWRATTAARRRPRPMSASRSLRDASSACFSTVSHWLSVTSASARLNWRAACASRRSPSSTDSSNFIVRRKWRISERALPVRTNVSQAGFGRATGPVTISTMSPLRSGVRSGWISLLMRAATHLLPTSVWML